MSVATKKTTKTKKAKPYVISFKCKLVFVSYIGYDPEPWSKALLI